MWNPFRDSWGLPGGREVFNDSLSEVGSKTGLGEVDATANEQKRIKEGNEAAATKAAKAKAVLDAAVAAGQDILSRKRARTAQIYRPYESTSQFTLGGSTKLGA